jgi:hypothetical protein
MKYIHIYDTRAEYNAAEKQHYDMSLIRNEDNYVVFYEDYSTDYFTIQITRAGYFTVVPAIDPKNNQFTTIDPSIALTISYSINGGEWISIQLLTLGLTLDVKVNDIIRFKGTNTNYCNNIGAKDPHKKWYIIFGCINHDGEEYKNEFTSTTARFDAYGNIMSLIYGDDFIGQTELPSTYTFCQLFKTSGIVSAKHLILPAATLTASCYRAMFSKAYRLKISPSFPAKNLVTECYKYMFEDCFNLKQITCLAETGLDNPTSATSGINYFTTYSKALQPNGLFIKSANATWPTDKNGIPKGWTVQNYEGE